MPAHETEIPAAANAGQTYESLCKLPVFRPVALKLLKTLACEDPEVRQITRLLTADPGLSAEVMTLANSALYGSTNTIRTIERAVLVVGMERMKSLALTVALQAFLRAVPESEATRAAWRHSMACAFAAEELGAAYGQPREAAYMAGLMHDLGRFGLLAAYPGRGEGAPVPVLYENGAAVLEEERRQFGMDHAQAGACLVQAWGLPEDFRAVAGHHHDEDAAAETTAVGLVRTACLVADALGYEGLGKAAVPDCAAIAGALPPRLSSALRQAECGLRERVDERFRQLDGALEP